MSAAKTIISFFMQGSMRGPRYVQFNFHTLRLFVLPRINLDVINDYEELDAPCFYILTGEDGGERIAYIGQAASFKHRVIDHKQKKEFWDTAYVLVASDKESLSTTDVQYLEYRGIQDALAVSAFNMNENKQKPKKPTLLKHRESDLDQIYDELKLLVEFVGCDIFVKPENTNNQVFYIKAKGIEAHGYYDTNSHQFVVQKGSEVVPDEVDSFHNKQQRHKLISELTDKKGGKLVVKKDTSFASPSGAAGFILGRPSNGWDEWKDKDGIKLSSIKG